MNELTKLAQRYEDKATELRSLLDDTKDSIERIVLNAQIVTYQTVATDIYTRILEIQTQN
jgi:hypothetical protein